MSEVAVASSCFGFALPPFISVVLGGIAIVTAAYKYIFNRKPEPSTLQTFLNWIWTKADFMTVLGSGTILIICFFLKRINQARLRSEDIPDESSTTNQYGQRSTKKQKSTTRDNVKTKRRPKLDELAENFSDESESSEFEESSNEDQCESEKPVKTISTHIVNRLDRFVRLGGMVQRISERTSIPIEEVLEFGASLSQAFSSSLTDHHAGHIVRIKSIHSKIKNNFNTFYKKLFNFGGHVQTIGKWANVWHGIGGDIDRLQENFYNDLLKIDFSFRPTKKAKRILQELKNKFLEALKQVLRGQRRGDQLSLEQKSEIEQAIQLIENYAIEDLFEKGRNGYLGSHTEYAPKE